MGHHCLDGEVVRSIEQRGNLKRTQHHSIVAWRLSADLRGSRHRRQWRERDNHKKQFDQKFRELVLKLFGIHESLPECLTLGCAVMDAYTVETVLHPGLVSRHVEDIYEMVADDRIVEQAAVELTYVRLVSELAYQDNIS